MFSSTVLAQKTTPITPSQSFVRQLAKEYCSTAYPILSSVNLDPERYSQSSAPADLFKHFSTIVHEDYHIMNHQLNGGHLADESGVRKYWVHDKLTIEVPKFEVFNSKLISTWVPSEISDQLPSFNTYLLDNYKYQHDAQLNGILGIMEEFLAYYQGARAYIESFDYLLSNAEQTDPEEWAKYFANAADVYAYYEFQLFITWYLEVAKMHHPEVHRAILDNYNFRVLYTVVDDAYGELISRYYENRETAVNYWTDLGESMYIKHNYLWTQKADGSGSIGYDLPDRTIRTLKRFQDFHSFDMIDELRVYDVGMIESGSPSAPHRSTASANAAHR